MFTAILKSFDNRKILKDALKKLAQMEVLVGIPEVNNAKAVRTEEKATKGQSVGNAQLLFIHTNGSPAKNIPPRPVIEPAIENSKDKISKQLQVAAKAIFDKKPEEAHRALELAGMRGQNAARAWFLSPSNGWPPLKPATIKAKGSAQILIDSGQLRKSIIYVVVDS